MSKRPTSPRSHSSSLSHPWLVWAICTVARSGSSWLSELVTSTGMMGLPAEYLLDWRQQATARGLSCASHFEDYLVLLLQQHSTPNGVFAVKGSVDELQPFLQYFPNAPCVWLQRENKIEQAVSWHRAHDGGIWTKRAGPTPSGSFAFSVERAVHFYDEILRRERLWAQFFARRAAPPLVLTYETLSRNPLDGVRAIAAHIGVGADNITRVASPMRIVRNAATQAWGRRVERALQARQASS